VGGPPINSYVGGVKAPKKVRLVSQENFGHRQIQWKKLKSWDSLLRSEILPIFNDQGRGEWKVKSQKDKIDTTWKHLSRKREWKKQSPRWQARQSRNQRQDRPRRKYLPVDQRNYHQIENRRSARHRGERRVAGDNVNEGGIKIYNNNRNKRRKEKGIYRRLSGEGGKKNVRSLSTWPRFEQKVAEIEREGREKETWQAGKCPGLGGHVDGGKRGNRTQFDRGNFLEGKRSHEAGDGLLSHNGHIAGEGTKTPSEEENERASP